MPAIFSSAAMGTLVIIENRVSLLEKYERDAIGETTREIGFCHEKTAKLT